MNPSEQIQIGSTVVRYLGDHRLVFRDAHDSTQMQMIDMVDVPRLIDFLLRWSDAALDSQRADSKGDNDAA
ncbi:MAG TPA: hypothetical protein VES94_07480 [Burkholderiales bacterium]|nr:hypothetical protein [Burkholderiales bacterium]